MFCSSCGKPMDDADKFCSYCGASAVMVPKSRAEEINDLPQVNEDRASASQAAEENNDNSENPLFSSDDFDEMRKRITEKAGKATEAVSSTASNALEKVSKSISSGKKKAESSTKISSPEPERAGLVSNEYSGSNYMTQKELWTWLKKDSKRQQFYTDDIDTETEDEYIDVLREKLRENQVPVKVEKRAITWDRSGAGEALYFVTPTTKVVNPLSYIVQFSHVGKFTYVEEKTFITPPKLPQSPHVKKPVDREGLARANQMMMFGGAAIILGIVFMSMRLGTSASFTIMGAGALILFIGLFLKGRINDILQYNAKCDQEMAAWNRAWNKWQTSIFIHSFQEDANGQLSRIFDSVYTTINQLNDVKYKDRKTLEDRDINEMAELENMIKIKQQEYR